MPAGWVGGMTALLLVPATDARSGSGDIANPAPLYQGCSVPILHGSCCAGLTLDPGWATALQPLLSADGQCAMAAQHTALPGISVSDWPVLGGLSSAMGLTLSAVGWGTV